MHWPQRAAAILAVCLLGTTPAHAGWQDTPDSLGLQSVGETMQVNGTPMQIRAFVTTQLADAVVADMQARWRRGGGPVTLTHTSAWTILNQSVGDQHRSFQIRTTKGGTAEGFVALTSPKLVRPVKYAVSLPRDMTVVSVIDSVDRGRNSQQVVAVSPRSISATMSSLESTLKAAGWERHRIQSSRNSIMYAANKGKQQLDATLAAQPAGSMIMMNVILN